VRGVKIWCIAAIQIRHPERSVAIQLQQNEIATHGNGKNVKAGQLNVMNSLSGCIN
jgi:hypothetical protein